MNTQTIEVPERLNGHRVRMAGQKKDRSGQMMVLVETAREWVVATWGPVLKDQWVWGSYIPKDETERAHGLFREMTVDGTRVAG